LLYLGQAWWIGQLSQITSAATTDDSALAPNPKVRKPKTMHICLFDIDGTLLNTGGAGQAAMEAALRSEFGITWPAAGIPMAGRTDRAIMVDLLKHFGLSADAETWNAARAGYLHHLPRTLDDRAGSVLPGIVELLEALSARDDVSLGLLTGNFRDGARLKLEYYALHHHFEFGGYGDEHLHRDDVARQALDTANSHHNGPVELNRVWVIGDTPADIACARAIGANAVAVGTGLYPLEDLEAEKPDHLLADFADPEPLWSLLQ
jgi:phosphoglycolate phosphatase-like HAD superfamily hydrolase